MGFFGLGFIAGRTQAGSGGKIIYLVIDMLTHLADASGGGGGRLTVGKELTFLLLDLIPGQALASYGEADEGNENPDQYDRADHEQNEFDTVNEARFHLIRDLFRSCQHILCERVHSNSSPGKPV